jgi:hypothetical protein
MKSDSYKTFTYPESYDEIECEKFIDHWKPLAFFIAFNILKSRKLFYGLDLARSSALEACFRTFVVTEKLGIKDYFHIKGILRKIINRTFWTMATVFGFIASSGQIYFPKYFVDYETFFKNRAIDFNYSEIDANMIKEMASCFPEKEYQIFQMDLAGYDFVEIANKLGYANKSSPLKMHYRSIERLKNRVKGEYGQANFKSKIVIG